MNLRKLAKGQECQVRIPGICNRDPETTVLAHLNGGGMGRKQPDLLGAWACAACHRWLDGGYVDLRTRDQRDLLHFETIIRHTRVQRDLLHFEAIIRTQQKLLEMGLQGAIDAWRK